jgi:hypothetical protein
MLQDVVAKRHQQPRDPAAVKATAAAASAWLAPQVAGGLVLHVWSRYLGPEADKGVADDWVELAPAEQATLAPPVGAVVGTSWELPLLADRLFPYCYPAVCNYEAKAGKVLASGLTATLAGGTPQSQQISLRGYLEMAHSRDGKIDGRVVARFVGAAAYEPPKARVVSFQLVSDKAAYVWHWQGKRNSTPWIAIVAETKPGRP